MPENAGIKSRVNYRFGNAFVCKLLLGLAYKECIFFKKNFIFMNITNRQIDFFFFSDK